MKFWQNLNRGKTAAIQRPEPTDATLLYLEAKRSWRWSEGPSEGIRRIRRGFPEEEPSATAVCIDEGRGKSAALLSLYAGHDTRSGVKVSNGPVRRNQIAEDKLASARMRAKEVGGETRRTRTESGYKAFSRASQHWMAKPQP